MTLLFDALTTIFNTLSRNDKIIFPNTNLLNFSNNKISTPAGDVFPLLQQHRSKLSEHLINFGSLKQLTNRLSDTQSIVRLNHVGFCYKVNSQEKEKKRLIDLIKLVFGNAIKPYSIEINGVVYIVRSHLGIIDGVNINLDLATKARNVKSTRQRFLNRID